MFKDYKTYNKKYLLGDIHGYWGVIAQHIMHYLEKNIAYIQVGDFGIGFNSVEKEGERLKELNKILDEYECDLYVIRGNHDNPAKCKVHPNWIRDGHYDDSLRMMFLGGGYSVDRHLRVEGRDWWPDEEMRLSEYYELLIKYEEEKPRVMVTHDCPEIEELMLPLIGANSLITTRTGQVFRSMWHAHQPDIWVFGHYHKSLDMFIGNTRFICVDQMQFKDLDI